MLARVQQAIEPEQPAVHVPRGISFHEFMHRHARVRTASGFVPYSTAGREPLLCAIAVIDFVLGNPTTYMPPVQYAELFDGLNWQLGKPLADCQLDLCGGAQFGKTIIGLHLKAYLAACRGLNSFYALPDDDLVQGIVDGKERPEVIDQIPWLAELVQLGKGLNASGKAVDRKGAMLYSDGTVSAMAYMRGINAKVPTTFSADCVIEDEKDDIRDYNARFLTGRMTASALRFHLTIGTQRYAGAGQNKELEAGTQHVGFLRCLNCDAEINPEEAWPKIARMLVGDYTRPSDPWLTAEGDFAGPQSSGRVAFRHNAQYYFACPDCGQELDRTDILLRARRPERIPALKWSIRVSQMCCSGLPVKMFVADWCQAAVRDPDAMKAFACDRLAIPRSTAQSITPAVLTRATALEPVTLSLTPAAAGVVRYAGLDTGDRCWFLCRETDCATGRKRTVWAESIAAESVRARVPALCATLGVSALCVDAGPLRDLARDLCLLLNRIEATGQAVDPAASCYWPHGLQWDAERKAWRKLACAAVEFTGKPGAGVLQAARITPGGGALYPVVSVNRDEALDMLVAELLTAAEGVAQVGQDGKLRSEPLWLLPQDLPGAPAIVATLHAHILAGGRKERSADGREDHWVDQVENHLLLAACYAHLAELVAPARAAAGYVSVESVPAVPAAMEEIL
jgi:hypothetical protein